MAYRKGDIPKVKLDIPNAPKFDLGDLTEPMSNMDRLFDNIAKDIRERQDNAMAMEFTKRIGELLRKNGVVPKLTEYTRNFETDNTFETKYGVSIDELDFSEHDKVFEDKIARLEENVGYYKDSLSRVEKNCDKLYHENKELKQRIAELESKETKKPIKGWICVVAKEINGQEYVKLEDFMSVMNGLREQNRLEDDGK